MVTDGLYEWETTGDAAGAWTHLADMLRTRRAEGGEILWEAIQQRIHAASPNETEPRDDQTLLVWQCAI
jgi:hypothetical protein